MSAGQAIELVLPTRSRHSNCRAGSHKSVGHGQRLCLRCRALGRGPMAVVTGFFAYHAVPTMLGRSVQ